MTDFEQPNESEVRRQPEVKASAEDLITDYSHMLAGLLEAALYRDPNIALEGYALDFLNKYHDQIPKETLDAIHFRRQDLQAKITNRPATRQ